MRILVLGGSGMLGHKITQKFKENFEVIAAFRGSPEPFRRLEIFRGAELVGGIDAEHIASVDQCLQNYRPEAVLNCVGVIKQLPEGQDVVKTLTVNSIFPHRLAELGKTYGFRLINISTDCVFDGKKGDYTENDLPDAPDLYGKSKNLGEVTGENCLTVRTSIIGRELFTRHSLFEWFMSRRGGRVRGFVNAIFTGFPTVFLAEILEKILTEQTELSGLYHVSSEKINKFELLELFNRYFQTGIEIERDEDFVLDRSLDSSKFRGETGFEPPAWEKMIEKMYEDAAVYENLEQ